ncbi:MAG: TIGR04255 family protein [Anaerolineales bacterium]|nr:TIGR04255 family protein [Anaerolineales bacterium]
MGREYRNPPVIEALCEIQFDPSSSWDVTIFGHYYDQIKAEFSQKRQIPQVEMALDKRPGGMRGEIRDAGMRMQFVRPDSSAMIQLAPHLLVVNQLSPYQSWDVFKELILARLADYYRVAGQVLIKGIGLRYINRFDFPQADFRVGNVFGPSEFLPPRLEQAGAPFFIRLEIPQDERERLLLTLGTIEGESDERVSVLLDLDYQSQIDARLEKSVLSAYLEKAHESIEEIFESCLTEALRERFDTEEDNLRG